MCLHIQAAHELRCGTEVLHESDLCVDLRHYIAGRLRVRQGVRTASGIDKQTSGDAALVTS